MCACVHVCVQRATCVRACVHAVRDTERACVCVCACACARACVRVPLHVRAQRELQKHVCRGGRRWHAQAPAGLEQRDDSRRNKLHVRPALENIYVRPGRADA